MSLNNCHSCGKQLSGYAKRQHHCECSLCRLRTIEREERDLKKQAEFGVDRNVESVREKLLQRSKIGLNKYGTTTERNDIDRLGWLLHLQEELMDACVYIEAVMRKAK